MTSHYHYSITYYLLTNESNEQTCHPHTDSVTFLNSQTDREVCEWGDGLLNYGRTKTIQKISLRRIATVCSNALALETAKKQAVQRCRDGVSGRWLSKTSSIAFHIFSQDSCERCLWLMWLMTHMTHTAHPTKTGKIDSCKWESYDYSLNMQPAKTDNDNLQWIIY